jgi:hypothetical protein
VLYVLVRELQHYTLKATLSQNSANLIQWEGRRGFYGKI